MLPYYVTFIISSIFCYMAEKSLRNDMNYFPVENINYNNENNKKRWVLNLKINKKKFAWKKYHIFFAISILTVVALAGMRGYNVGTDVLVYGNNLFYYARTVNISKFITKLSNIEELYLILVYFSSKLSSDPHVLYFLTGLIIYLFIFLGLKEFRYKVSISFGWLCFLCLLFGDTLNAMRQCLAIAVGFWAFNFIEKRQYFYYIIAMVCAFFFHNSALICIIISGIYIILQINNKLWVKIVLTGIAIVGLLYFNQILIFLIDTGTLDLKMAKYFIGNSNGLSIPAILIRLPFLILIILQRKQFCYGNNEKEKIRPLKNQAEADFLIIMLITEMFTVEMSAFVSSLYRISLYFVPFRCVAYARLYAVQKGKNKVIYGALLIVYLLIIFIYQNEIKGNNEIYPYVFGIFQ